VSATVWAADAAGPGTVAVAAVSLVVVQIVARSVLARRQRVGGLPLRPEPRA
jgi:hypothetical protein